LDPVVGVGTDVGEGKHRHGCWYDHKRKRSGYADTVAMRAMICRRAVTMVRAVIGGGARVFVPMVAAQPHVVVMGGCRAGALMVCLSITYLTHERLTRRGGDCEERETGHEPAAECWR